MCKGKMKSVLNAKKNKADKGVNLSQANEKCTIHFKINVFISYK